MSEGFWQGVVYRRGSPWTTIDTKHATEEDAIKKGNETVAHLQKLTPDPLGLRVVFVQPRAPKK